jgi:hypothetical protein
MFAFVNPQLLEGAWTANAPRLSELVADFELVSDLATFYGRIEELRWRLRTRTEQGTTGLDKMTRPLVGELRGEVADLLVRVRAQIDKPDVQPTGLVRKVALAAAGEASASLGIKVIRAQGRQEPNDPQG